MTSPDGVPPPPWHRIQGTNDASTMWYAVMRRRERGVYIGALVLRHSDHHTLLLQRGWEEGPIEAIGGPEDRATTGGFDPPPAPPAPPPPPPRLPRRRASASPTASRRFAAKSIWSIAGGSSRNVTARSPARSSWTSIEPSLRLCTPTCQRGRRRRMLRRIRKKPPTQAVSRARTSSASIA